MAGTVSSRIFVKGLPPTFTESEFRTHFSQSREITDAKIFPNRRIGYIGYRTPEDAQHALKYFNRTFIRMSRIGVELARPIQDAQNARHHGAAPTAQRRPDVDNGPDVKQPVKRKRGSDVDKEDDPKLKEFLDVYKPKNKKKAWENEGLDTAVAAETRADKVGAQAFEEVHSDEEYEEVPNKARRAKRDNVPAEHDTAQVEVQLGEDEVMQPTVNAVVEGPASQVGSGDVVTDADWTRSRTSRLLGLLDEDEETETTRDGGDAQSAYNDEDEDVVKGSNKSVAGIKAPQSMPTPPSDKEQEATTEEADAATERTESTMRLFLRNLAYDVRAEDLETQFAQYGSLDEVSSCICVLPISKMNT